MERENQGSRTLGDNLDPMVDRSGFLPAAPDRAGRRAGHHLGRGGFGVWAAFTGGPNCTPPSRLETFQGVTLQPDALDAFKRAERIAGRTIHVVQSYRSCASQALACQRLCGDSAGCPGTCAEPGTSYHQRGWAIDVTAASLRAPRVIGALRKAGCQSVPKSDPGHFSYQGCH
jgi:hypothetical protein